MNTQFDELTRNLAQSVTRRQAAKKFAVHLAAMALAGLVSAPAGAFGSTLGPLIELSRPNAVGSCDEHFVTFPATSVSLDDAVESLLAVNPVNSKNIIAVGHKACCGTLSPQFRWTAAGPGSKSRCPSRSAPAGRCWARVMSESALHPTETRT